MALRFLRPLLDRFGATGSLLCALHCAALPIAVAAAPTAGLAGLTGAFADGLERGFVVFATLLGLASLLWGYRNHRTLRALSLMAPGLLVLWIGVLYAPLHHSLVPHAIAMSVGGTLVGLAHLANLRLNHGHVHDARCTH